MLAVDQQVNPDLNAHVDIIGDVILPALIKASTEQAQMSYGGTYRSVGNSSITISASDGKPGLAITTLSVDGVDARTLLAKLNGIDPLGLSIRLYPTNVESRKNHGVKIAYRAVFEDENAFADAGTPT